MRLRILMLVALLCAAVSPAWPASTINTTLPVQGVPYSAAPIRQNFGAAASDIGALQSLNAGASAPSSPGLGTLWLNTSSPSVYTLNIYVASTHSWAPIARLDPATGAWMPPVGGGTIPSIVSAATTDLGSVPQAAVNITGSQSIASFGSSTPAGEVKFLTFTGAPTLVYNSTFMILPDNINLTLSASQSLVALSLGGGAWRVGFSSLNLGSLGANHPIPSSASYTGAWDYLRVSINNFPTTSEFAGDPVATIGSVQGIVGAVVQPADVSSTVSAWFGVAGYSACNTGVGVAGSCTGVSGNGVALGSASAGTMSLTVGINGVATNNPHVTNMVTRSGFDYVNLTAGEFDVANMKLADGSAPHANVVGISIVGVSETQPSSGATDCSGAPCLAAGIFINPMGLSPPVGWIDAIRITDGAATRDGLSIGAVCQATAQCSAAPIVLDAYSAAGAGSLIHGTLGLTGTGFFSLNAPASGQVALQVDAVTVLGATSSGITAAQPITATEVRGGAAAGSALTLRSTSNGAPSADSVSINASTTFFGSADGITPFGGFTSTRFDLATPVRFSTSTTGAVTPAFTNAPAGCTNPIWIGPMEVSAPALSNVYLAACRL